MDIWIIQNGEKLGPFHDFDIRRKISSGEFHADLPAWHEGIASWTTLGQMTVFADEFARIAATPAKDPESTGPPAATPPPLPDHPFALRRFWARWLDLYGYTAIWWLTMWASGRDIAAILNQPWIMLMQYVPWFVIETWMIHRFTTTPGKWLLGIRILNADGSPLTLPEATRRSARVFFLGIGFGLELHTQLGHLHGAPFHRPHAVCHGSSNKTKSSTQRTTRADATVVSAQALNLTNC